jgi:MerR family copper efflux transcriptional regulator
MLDSVVDSILYDSGVEVGSSMGAATGTYKIGDVAKLSGVGIETLRFYEKSGLLDRPARTASGYRLYDASIVERLAFIKKAQVLGFTLDEIRELISHKRAGESPCGHVRAKVKSRLTELDERIRQMTLYRDELAAELKQWEKKREVAGHVCGLIEGSHIEHPAAAQKFGRK